MNRLSRCAPVADVVAILGIVFFAFYHLTGFRFDTLFTNEARLVDFLIWRFDPSYIFEHGRYPAVVTGDWEHLTFPYLPSAAVMMRPLSWPPQAPAFALWLLIEAGAFALSLWASLRLSGVAALPGRWLIALGAVLMCENSIAWDFRNHNNCMIYLALVMLGLVNRRLWLSALFFALSINLKLYSGFIPVALACRREVRLAVAIGLVAALIAIGLPVAVFGPAGAWQLAIDWAAQIDHTLSPTLQAEKSASLIGSVAALFALDPASSTANVVLRAFQIAWLALVGFYFFICARAGVAQDGRYHQLRLADVCVALMMPLPLSTWFIPYHAVVLLPAYTLLIAIAAAADWPKRVRACAIAACIASQILHFGVHAWTYRGMVFLAIFTILVSALIVVRRAAPARHG